MHQPTGVVTTTRPASPTDSVYLILTILPKRDTIEEHVQIKHGRAGTVFDNALVNRLLPMYRYVLIGRQISKTTERQSIAAMRLTPIRIAAVTTVNARTPSKSSPSINYQPTSTPLPLFLSRLLRPIHRHHQLLPPCQAHLPAQLQCLQSQLL